MEHFSRSSSGIPVVVMFFALTLTLHCRSAHTVVFDTGKTERVDSGGVQPSRNSTCTERPSESCKIVRFGAVLVPDRVLVCRSDMRLSGGH